jgi:hypothetical protein
MAPRGDKNGIKAYASRVNKKNRSKRLPFHPDAVRLKIKAVLLVQKLQAHIFDGIEMSMSQIRAAEILLRKCIPDLSTATITADINVRYVAHLPEPISREAWLAKYSGDYLDPAHTIEGTTNGSGTKIQ